MMKFLLFVIIAMIAVIVLFFLLRLYRIYQNNHLPKSKDETDGMFLLMSDKKSQREDED